MTPFLSTDFRITNFIAQYKKQSAERAGQFFVNRYIKGEAWPELFYERNDEKALWMIREWFDRQALIDFQNNHDLIK